MRFIPLWVTALLFPMILSASGIDVSTWSLCSWRGCWEIGANLIYWKPISNDFVYGVKKIDSSHSQLFTVDNGFSAGFRVKGGYHSCDGRYAFLLRFTHLLNQERDKTEDLSFIGLSGGSLLGGYEIEGESKFEYNAVDLKMNVNFCRRGAFDLSVFGEARYICLLQKAKRRGFQKQQMGSPQFVQTTFRSEFEGFGLGVGVVGSYAFCKGFKVCTEIGGLLAVGDRFCNALASIDPVTPTQKIGALVPSEFGCIPSFHADVKVCYYRMWESLILILEGGYEAVYYFSILRSYDVERLNTRSFDVGFQGPFVGIQVRF